MFRPLATAAALFVLGSAGHAAACSSVPGVLAHFETVKNAYIEKAPNMKPEQFPIWTAHLETFGEKMSAQDFVGACQALDDAAAELGFEVAAAPTSTQAGGGATAAAAAAPAAPAASDSGSVTVGNGVTVGSGVTIGSGSAPAPSGGDTVYRVRTRARPER